MVFGVDVSPLDTLTKWEESGAIWRTKSLTKEDAVVDLCACTGEPVDQLRSSDPALLAYLEHRPRSEF